MSVSLTKGRRVSLVKDAGLESIMIGIGWDTNRYQGSADFDLDLVLFMLGENDKVIDDKHFIYFKNDTDPAGSVVYSGDNRTGEGDGDDETVTIDFSKVPANVKKIVVAVTIYDAVARNQNFGLVDNSFIRFVNNKNGEETHRYDLCEDFSTQTSVVFGVLYRHGDDWKFNPVGEGYNKELKDLCIEYGLEVKNE